MTTTQVPPDGVPAEFRFEIPAPEGLTTIGGVRVYFVFDSQRPDFGDFFPRLYLNDGEPCALSDSGMGPKSITRVCHIPEALTAPVQARLTLNEEGALAPGNGVTIYAWGAQTESGDGALNPDEGDQPSIMTPTIEVGQVEVLTWQEWNRITGANQGEEVGS